ncbi:adenylate cyclase 3 [Sarotherodon galilaeus]
MINNDRAAADEIHEDVFTVFQLSVMKRCGLILLLLSGYVMVCHLQSDQLVRQLHLVDLQKSWNDAQQYCRDEYIDLAIVNSSALIQEAQKRAGSTEAWIGLFKSGWKWSQTGPVQSSWLNFWFPGQPGTDECVIITGYGSWFTRPVWKWSYTGTGKSTFTNWGPGEPGVEKCVTVSALGIWSTRDCSEEKHFICYSDDAGRYILVQDSRSFYGAQSYCRDRYTDLSSINSVVNNTEIMTLLASDIYDSYSMNGSRWLIPSLSLAWIGLSNSWEWSDGSDIQFLPLTLQSADGDCMMVDQSSSSLLFQPCNNTYPFLCYQAESGSADLNNPAVQESILQQVREKLVEQGIREDVKPRWRTQPDGRIFHREEETAGYCEEEDCGSV